MIRFYKDPEGESALENSITLKAPKSHQERQDSSDVRVLNSKFNDGNMSLQNKMQVWSECVDLCIIYSDSLTL